MSGTITPNRSQRDRWVARFTGIQIGRRSGGGNPPPLPPRPSPRQQPRTDPAQAYEAARARAQPVLDLAQHVVPTNNAMRQLAGDLLNRLDALEAAASDGKFETALELLPPAAAAARALLNARSTEQAKTRQLAGQREHFDNMKDVFDSVTTTYFNPNAGSSSKRLRKQGLNAGKHFKAYLDALEAMEQVRAQLPKTGPFEPDQAETARQAANGVLTAAQGYIEHFDSDFSTREKKDKNNLRKLQVVNEGLKSARHFLLALDFLALPPPTQDQPWDTETESKATGLRAAISFETGYKKAGGLGEDGGQMQSFWVEQRAPRSQKPTKDFLFKPSRGEITKYDSITPGSGVLNEALAFGNAKQFEQQTGIGLGIPETHVVTIGAHALDLQGDDNDGQPRIGSLQEFEPSDGVLRNFSSVFKQIAPEDCQKIMLHDIMALNFDRHGGNVLVQQGAGKGGGPRLIPIDHGCTLPPRAAFDAGAGQCMGGLDYMRTPEGAVVNVMNVMLRIPGAYEKLDDDTVARLQLLDPEAMVQGMRDRVQGIDEANPGFNGQEKLPEDSLLMSKRAMMFLKLAASELSPAEIQIAIGQHGAELFDASDDDFEQVARQVISKVQPNKAGYQEIFSVPNLERDTLFSTLQNSGWAPASGTLSKWVMANPEQALLLAKSGVVNPNAPQPATQEDVDREMQDLNRDEVLRAYTQKLLDQVEEALRDVGPNEAGGLQPLRQDIAEKLEANELSDAEAAARDLLAQAVGIAVPFLRAEGEQLYARRDALFAGLGSREEVQKQLERLPSGSQERQDLWIWSNTRGLFDQYWVALVQATGQSPNLQVAKTNVDKLRAAVEQYG